METFDSAWRGIKLVELTGWHRDCARATSRDALTLKSSLPEAAERPRTGRIVTKTLGKGASVFAMRRPR